MRESTDDSPEADAAYLARCLQMGLAAHSPWRTEELGAAWEYELSAPLPQRPDNAPQTPNPPKPGGSEAAFPFHSVRDLLQQPHPPVASLQLIKQYAKNHSEHPRGSVPREVALALYYGSICAALLRCQTRISQLEDAQLRKGIAWALTQSWLDDATRRLLSDTQAVVATDGDPNEPRS